MYIDTLELINQYAELIVSKKKLMSYLSFKDYSNSKIRTRIKAAQEYRHMKIADRNLEVVYFTGNSGSGKTTAAKYFAEKLNYDYFISGSGDDIFDGYDKEECIILDDFRAGTMRFMETLKMLDNNTNSSVKSRYVNKDLSNCKLIIITSISKPSELYHKLSDTENQEPAEQFYRRLKHHYFQVSDDGELVEYSLKMDSFEKETGKSLGNIHKIFEELGIDPSKVDLTSKLDTFIVPNGSSEQNVF